MIKKIVFVLFLYTFLANFSQAQVTVNNTSFDVAIMSPNASSLGKYGQVPVGLFTGTPQVHIPLYNFTTRGVSLPISLNYVTNGVKVNEIASQVGMSWDLSTGGVIIRTLYGGPDEDGELASSLTEYAEGGKDNQPDIFSFSFNGYSGKFFLDNDRIPTLTEPSPLKIVKLEDLSDIDANYPEFVITTPSGASYYFGGINAIETTKTADKKIKTAWYLTKIINNSSSEQINLSYSQKEYTYEVGLSEERYDVLQSNLDICDGGYFRHVANITVNTSYIDEIIASDTKQKIEFVYIENLDVFVPERKRLDLINIINADGEVFKRFKFEYTTFGSDPTYQNHDISNQNMLDKRLFLDRVVEKSQDNDELPPHIFEYYNPEQLPQRLSYAQDYWGYFNGKKNKTLLPSDFTNYDKSNYIKVLIDILTIDELDNLYQNTERGNRTSDHAYGVKGMLKKITYPTGGNNEFIYEPHSYMGQKYIKEKKQTYYLDAKTDDFGDGDPNKDDNTDFQVASFDQKAFLTLDIDYSTYCGGQSLPEQEDLDAIEAEVTVLDITNANSLDIFKQDAQGNITTIGSVLKLQGTNFLIDKYFVEVKTGIDYNFQLEVTNSCTEANASISYVTEKGKMQDTNIEVGGSRIAKLLTNDLNNSITTKRYYYADLDLEDLTSLNTNSGVIFNKFEPSIHYYYPSALASNGFQLEYCSYINFHSSSLHSLFNRQGYHIAYKNVIEGIGEDFDGGGVLHTFDIKKDITPTYIYGDKISNAIYGNPIGNGNKRKSVIFKKGINKFIALSKTKYEYKDDARLSKIITGFNLSARTFLVGLNQHTIANSSSYNLTSSWRYLENVKTTHGRVEEVNDTYDFIVSRAVAQMETFVRWTKGKIAKKQNHDLKNGILYLKGGDLSEELKIYTSATIYDLPTYFEEDFFETKKVVHLGMKFKS